MKLSEIREAYEVLSSKLSEINRQLCFAGFAIIWIFNKSEGSILIPNELHFPAFLFVISLLADILQYFISSIIWYIYYFTNRKENTDESTQEINESEFYNIPGWLFYITKIISLIWGYSSLANYLFN